MFIVFMLHIDRFTLVSFVIINSKVVLFITLSICRRYVATCLVSDEYFQVVHFHCSVVTRC